MQKELLKTWFPLENMETQQDQDIANVGTKDMLCETQRERS